MFKLVVLSALVAIVAAKPGGLLGYSAIAAPAVVAAPAVAIPAAVSHQYRTDVISKPVVATYAAAPIVQKTVVAAAPAVYAAAPVAYAGHYGHYAHAAPLAHAALAAPIAHAW
ncbi:hypothetical protein Zmor_006203 [Zophobas morio]|uniref:Cuticle protein n=1 Tax=Zophobas morio TaxID=2755281 RepID=A0AA38MMM9_9CUCU|nr:hypothetical protein Zmor_006203 [Zophobas morio]